MVIKATALLWLAQLFGAAGLAGGDLRREVGGSSLGEAGLEKINNGRTRYRGTEGALTINDCLALRAMAESMCAPQGGTLRYAEVGSYLGLSATLVADACPKAIAFAHDVFPMAASDGALAPGTHPPPGTEMLLQRFWANVARNGLEGRVVPMRGFSQETLPVHADASLDMAFVDGDHSYGTTLVDLLQMWAKVRASRAVYRIETHNRPTLVYIFSNVTSITLF
jgi:hypothetical protein